MSSESSASPNESFVNDLLASEIVQEELDDDDVVEFREYLEKLIEKFVSVKALVQTGCFASEKDARDFLKNHGCAKARQRLFAAIMVSYMKKNQLLELALDDDKTQFDASMARLTRRVKAMKEFKPLLEQVCELGKQVQQHIAKKLEGTKAPILAKPASDLGSLEALHIMNDDNKKQLIEFLESNLTVVIVGLVNSGKTALVNALLGMSLLKSENKEATARVCHIKYGDTVKATVEFFDNDGKPLLDDKGQRVPPTPIALTATGAIPAEATVMPDKAGVRAVVRIECPSDLLKPREEGGAGIELYDTPGLGGKSDLLDKTVEKEIGNRPKALVYCLPFSEVVGQDASNKIDSLQSKRHQLVDGNNPDLVTFVLTKVDAAKPGQDLQEWLDTQRGEKSNVTTAEQLLKDVETRRQGLTDAFPHHFEKEHDNFFATSAFMSLRYELGGLVDGLDSYGVMVRLRRRLVVMCSALALSVLRKIFYDDVLRVLQLCYLLAVNSDSLQTRIKLAIVDVDAYRKMAKGLEESKKFHSDVETFMSAVVDAIGPFIKGELVNRMFKAAKEQGKYNDFPQVAENCKKGSKCSLKFQKEDGSSKCSNCEMVYASTCPEGVTWDNAVSLLQHEIASVIEEFIATGKCASLKDVKLLTHSPGYLEHAGQRALGNYSRFDNIAAINAVQCGVVPSMQQVRHSIDEAERRLLSRHFALFALDGDAKTFQPPEIVFWHWWRLRAAAGEILAKPLLSLHSLSTSESVSPSVICLAAIITFGVTTMPVTAAFTADYTARMLSESTEGMFSKSPDFVSSHSNIAPSAVKSLYDNKFTLAKKLTEQVIQETKDRATAFEDTLKRLQTTTDAVESLLTSLTISRDQFRLLVEETATNFIELLSDATDDAVLRAEVFQQYADSVVQRATWNGKEIVVKKMTQKSIVRKEIWSMLSMRHPNIVPLVGGHKFDEQWSSLFVPYYELGDLTRALSDKAVWTNIQDRFEVALQLANALDYLIRDQSMVHRDIKLENIFVASHNPPFVVLGDFGCAKSSEIAKTKIIGTEYTWPIERFDHQAKINAEKADVFSFGVVMVALCEKRNLQEDAIALYYDLKRNLQDEVGNGTWPPLPSTNKMDAETLHFKWIQIIRQCLHKDFKQRPTFQQLLSLLQKLNEEETAKSEKRVIVKKDDNDDE